LSLRIGPRGNAVVHAVQRNGRHHDRGKRGEPLLHAFEIGIAGRITEAVAVGLDHDIDEVGIVERCLRALVWRVDELDAWARSSSVRAGQTEVVQRFGRYYALTEVRWLAEVFSGLCNRSNVDAFFGAS